MANVRYMVSDTRAAVAFYTEHLGFELKKDWPVRDGLTRGPDALAQRPQDFGKETDARWTQA